MIVGSIRPYHYMRQWQRYLDNQDFQENRQSSSLTSDVAAAEHHYLPVNALGLMMKSGRANLQKFALQRPIFSLFLKRLEAQRASVAGAIEEEQPQLPAAA